MGQLYEFGQFRLDSRSESLSQDGQEIHLTAKGYATLLFLVDRAGSLVSKDEILAAVWPDGFIEPANLTQTIYVLRKALGDAHGRLIETVPSRGYRFTPPVRVGPCTNGVDHALPVAAPKPRARLLTIAAPIAAAMLLGFISLHARTAPPAAAAVNPQAQRDYVLGRHYWSERTLPDINLGLHYFKAALAIDPTYAQAESGVADSYSALGYYSPYSAKTMKYYDDARAAALRAVQFDPSSAEAHASLAFADEFAGKSHKPEIAREFERSIDLDGKYATAREWYSWYLYDHGAKDDAVAQMMQARNLDPTSPVINFALGSQLYYDRRYRDAADQWHFALTIAPDDAQSFYGAGLADEALGDDRRAEREFQRALAIAPGDPDVMGALAHTYARAREPGSAMRMLARIASLRPAPAYDIAMVKDALGERDQAIKWLAVAYSQHDTNIGQFSIDPRMADIRRIWMRQHGANA